MDDMRKLHDLVNRQNKEISKLTDGIRKLGIELGNTTEQLHKIILLLPKNVEYKYDINTFVRLVHRTDEFPSGVYGKKSVCIKCKCTNSFTWWKCCPEHTTQNGPEVVCSKCVVELHPRG